MDGRKQCKYHACILYSYQSIGKKKKTAFACFLRNEGEEKDQIFM